MFSTIATHESFLLLPWLEQPQDTSEAILWLSEAKHNLNSNCETAEA